MSTAPVLEATQDRSVKKARSGKYLTFCLGEGGFGLEILKIQEIIGFLPITAIPRTPHYVNGVINLRGDVIPVIDLRLKFEMSKSQRTDETCIIVVQVNGHEIGIIVDRVYEVRNILSDDIDPPPSFGTSIDSDYILGMSKADKGKVTILLDITKILSDDGDMLMDTLEENEQTRG